MIVNDANFNSIKVQLELNLERVMSNFQLFQFHKGTIRTFLFQGILHVCRYFNSIKVQLELTGNHQYLEASYISIP